MGGFIYGLLQGIVIAAVNHHSEKKSEKDFQKQTNLLKNQVTPEQLRNMMREQSECPASAIAEFQKISHGYRGHISTQEMIPMFFDMGKLADEACDDELYIFYRMYLIYTAEGFPRYPSRKCICELYTDVAWRFLGMLSLLTDGNLKPYIKTTIHTQLWIASVAHDRTMFSALEKKINKNSSWSDTPVYMYLQWSKEQSDNKRTVSFLTITAFVSALIGIPFFILDIIYVAFFFIITACVLYFVSKAFDQSPPYEHKYDVKTEFKSIDGENRQRKAQQAKVQSEVKSSDDQQKKQAVKLNSDAVEKLQRGEYEEAIKLLNSALQLAPEYTGALNNLGRCYEEVGENVKAMQAYKKAADIHKTAASTAGLARTCYKTGKLTLAQRFVEIYDATYKGEELNDLKSALKINERGQTSEAKAENEPEIKPEVLTSISVTDKKKNQFCGKCGKKIFDDNQFCVYCGAPIVPAAEQAEKEERTHVAAPVNSIELDTTNEKCQSEKDAQKRKTNRKKIIIISGISVAAVIAVLIGIYIYSYNRSLNFAKEGKFEQAESWLLVPGITKLHNSDLLTYIEAGQLLDAGDYDQATELIKDVDGDSNIQNMALEAQYQKAAVLVADGDTDSAFEIYKQLMEANYKDSQKIYINILDDEFKTALSDGDYETALNLYDNYPADYFGSDPNLESYMEAVWFYVGGSYAAAANEFEELGDYSDASTMAKESKYQEGVELLGGGNYQQAKECFDVLGDYCDSEDLVKECNYQYAIELHDDPNTLLKAYKTMVSVAGYSDADTLIEQYASEIYDLAREYYQSGIENYKTYGSAFSDFTAAQRNFEAISNYKYSANYLVLIEGLSGRSSDSTYKKLVNLIWLDDAKYAILNNYSFDFLEGSWYTSGGSYYFRLTNESGSSYHADYNLPGHISGSFSLNDGLYTVEGSSIYEFTIVDSNTINCYCYYNGSTYTLYRQ